MATQVKAMIKSKALYPLRDAGTGFKTHYARSASLHAVHSSQIGEQDFQIDSLIHKEANAAKHTSVGIRRLFEPSWADCDVTSLSSCEDTSSSQLDPWMTLGPWSEAACKLVTNGDCSATSRGLAADTMCSTCPLDVNAIEFVPDMPHAGFDLSSTTVDPYIEHLESLVRSQNSTIGLLMAKLGKFSSFPATLSGLWLPFAAFHMLEGESLDSEVNVLKARARRPAQRLLHYRSNFPRQLKPRWTIASLRSFGRFWLLQR